MANYSEDILFFKPRAKESGIEALLALIVAVSAVTLVWHMLNERSMVMIGLCGILLLLGVVGIVRVKMNPETVRARQTADILKLVQQTLNHTMSGVNPDSARRICHLLMPHTAAVAISITDTENLLAYIGYDEENNPPGNPIKTTATRSAVKDGKMRIITSREEIGFPSYDTVIKGAVIVPIFKGHQVAGTLKFYYRSPNQITETQVSIAEGLGHVLSTQVTATAMEEQQKLATSMELKALQAQINPHFLFNTINTIASLIRTDPSRARMLLREFAVFYRRTLEDSDDLIMLSREMDQVSRYFRFELARFGDDRLALAFGYTSDVIDMPVPPFLIQPLVENAVRHARPDSGMLTILVSGEMVDEETFVITVSDDGVGMTEEQVTNILHPESSTGCGIAVKNVHDRLIGYFGPGTHMEVTSELGKGTTTRLIMNVASIQEYL